MFVENKLSMTNIKMTLTKDRIYCSLLMLLGVFSTLQAFSVFNKTIFSIVLILLSVYILLRRKLYLFNNKLFFGYIIVSFITTGLTFFNDDFETVYLNTAILALLNMVLLYIVGASLVDRKEMSYFIDGFKLSCYIQLVWCLVQIIASRLFNINVNTILFNNILGYSGTFSSLRDGEIVCTGLHWHAANLIPIITVVLLLKTKIIWKILAVLAAVFSQSATMIIALGLVFLFKFAVLIKKVINGGRIINDKNIVSVISIVVCVTILAIIFAPKIIELLSYLIKRIADITSNEAGNSSAVHFRYYTSLPDVFKRASFITIMFGIGLGCSGLIFSSFYGQYEDITWIVESDFVNTLLSNGIIGFVIFYLFIIFLIRKLMLAKRVELAAFIFILLICGITYNLQFVWVVLLEIILAKYYSINGKSYADINVNNCNL